MPIHLVTGLPGNAKTLRCIQMLINRAKQENRAVYYAGLKEFKEDDPRLLGTEWKEFDPMTWHETVPSGALCFVDEAQKVFRARSMGSVPPKYVTELEEHRHKGLDFVLVTQHPSLIDPAVRRLSQVHEHMIRIFGMEASTVHLWSTGVKDNCDKSAARNDSEKTRWAFAKDLYGIYKSADAHTIKRRIPGRVKLLGLLVVVFIALVWLIYGQIKRKVTGSEPGPVATSPAGPGDVYAGKNTNTVEPQTNRASARPDPIEDAKDFAWRETPRVVGLQQTAPKYDAITVPVRAPVPAMCVQVGSVSSSNSSHSTSVRCKCYSQQGTQMAVEFNMCIDIARNGFFQDFDADKDKGSQRAENRPQSALSPQAVQMSAAIPMTPPTHVPLVADVPVVVALANTSSVSSQRSNLPDKLPDDGQRPSRTVIGWAK